jgi:hypothetical protein
MASVKFRVEQIEKLLGQAECLCGDSVAGAVEIVVVEDGWDEERIRLAEEAKGVACPIHGLQKVPTLRLVGSDVHG